MAKNSFDAPDDLKDILKKIASGQIDENTDIKNLENLPLPNSSTKNKSKNPRLAHWSTRESLNDLIKKTALRFGGEDESWTRYHKVMDDLKKIDFGKREIDYGFGDLKMPGFEKGFDELGEGLVVMWCGARGYDEEIPVAFCLYMENNGKSLRAYIPLKGNFINTVSKSSFEIDDYPNYTYDMAALREDASHRIKVDPKTFPKEENPFTIVNGGGGGIGVLDPSKLPPGTDILDALRGIARGQEMSQTAKDKKGTDILRTIQDLIEQDDIKKNGKIDTNVQTIDWKRIPNFTGFKKGEFSDLDAGKKIWKKEIANGGLVDEDLSYKTSFDRHFDFDIIRQHKTFKEYDDKASPEVARCQWLNKEYAKKNPSKTDMIFKFVKKGNGRFGYEFIIDKKTEKIVMVCFQDVELA